MSRQLLTFALTLVLLAASRTSAAAPPPAPADDPAAAAVVAVRRAFDARDYRGALRAAADALATAAPPLTAAQRYAVLTLKGEALLRLNERAYAIDAFDAAARAAGRERVTDAAVARATAVLIARSRGSQYKPAAGSAADRAAPGDTIDIVNPKFRPKALAAAYEDLLAEHRAAIAAALEGKQLPPMLDLVPALADLYVLESAAAGGEPRRTTDLLKSFGVHARDLMRAELARVGKRVDALSELADSSVGTDTAWGTHIDRRGLWTRERVELSDLIDYATRIRRAAQRARQISVSFNFTGENWDPLIAEAADTIDLAQQLWDRRY
jgi:hypothetical protein